MRKETRLHRARASSSATSLPEPIESIVVAKIDLETKIEMTDNNNNNACQVVPSAPPPEQTLRDLAALPVA